METIMALAVVILGGSAGDVCITKGMKQVGEISTVKLPQLCRTAAAILRNGNFLMGIGFMTMSFAAFLAVLSWADLSFVIPATSLSFVASTLGARWFLREKISRLRWTGILFVCLGVAMVSIH